MFLYPWGDMHSLNLGWFLLQFKDWVEKIQEYLDNGGGTSENLANVIAPVFNAANYYSAGDYVLYNNELYKANQAVNPGTWDPDAWTRCLIVDEMGSGGGAGVDNVARLMIAGQYSASFGYQKYAICRYSDKLWMCNTNLPSGGEEWEPSHWDEITVGAGLTGLRRSVETLSEDIVTLNDAINANATKTMLPVNPCLKRARLIAHKGGTSFVQSTDRCFQNGVMQGYQVIEADIKKTVDDEIIIWHDDTAGELVVAESTLAQLQALTFGYSGKIMSLEEFLQLIISNGIVAEIDLSHESITSSVATLIYNKVKAINPSFDSVIFTGSWSKLNMLVTFDPTIMLCISQLTQMSQIGDGVTSMVENSRYAMISQQYNALNPDIVTWAHNHNCIIKAYTISSSADLYTAFANGVDKAIVEALLPATQPYIYLGGENLVQSFVYNNRVSTDDSRMKSSIRLLYNNLLMINFHFTANSALTASQRTIMQLPEVLRPVGTMIGQAFIGADVDNLTVCSIDASSTNGYINLTHNANLAQGDHILGVFYLVINPLTANSNLI